jgi:hypothetical protein
VQTRLFGVAPSALETLAADAWLFYAPMDENGISSMPVLVRLHQIDSIGLAEARLPLATPVQCLDDHIGECVMLQVRDHAPHGVPPWTFHGVLRRAEGTIAYELDPPEHGHPLAASGEGLRFEYIAIARATLCPVTRAHEEQR